MIPAIGSALYPLFTKPCTVANELGETISHSAQYISNFAQEIIRQIGELFLGMAKFFDRQINSVVQPIADFFSIEPRKDPKNILAFYRNQEPNDVGMNFFDILKQDDAWMENRHNWVQRYFPDDKPSAADPTAPVLDRATIAAFQSDKEMLFRAIIPVFVRVLSFFGLTIDNEKNIIRGPNFLERATGRHRALGEPDGWLNRPHNFLRITRIIHSLGLMLGGDNEYGRALFRIMEDIYRNEGRGIIPQRSYEFWRDAAKM